MSKSLHKHMWGIRCVRLFTDQAPLVSQPIFLTILSINIFSPERLETTLTEGWEGWYRITTVTLTSQSMLLMPTRRIFTDLIISSKNFNYDETEYTIALGNFCKRSDTRFSQKLCVKRLVLERKGYALLVEVTGRTYWAQTKFLDVSFRSFNKFKVAE